MPCRDFEDLIIRTTSDQILRNKAFNIAKNLQYGGYQRRLALMIYKCFDEETSGGATTQNKFVFENKNISRKELADELHKPVIKKL